MTKMKNERKNQPSDQIESFLNDDLNLSDLLNSLRPDSDDLDKLLAEVTLSLSSAETEMATLLDEYRSIRASSTPLPVAEVLESQNLVNDAFSQMNDVSLLLTEVAAIDTAKSNIASLITALSNYSSLNTQILELEECEKLEDSVDLLRSSCALFEYFAKLNNEDFNEMAQKFAELKKNYRRIAEQKIIDFVDNKVFIDDAKIAVEVLLALSQGEDAADSVANKILAEYPVLFPKNAAQSALSRIDARFAYLAAPLENLGPKFKQISPEFPLIPKILSKFAKQTCHDLHNEVKALAASCNDPSAENNPLQTMRQVVALVYAFTEKVAILTGHDLAMMPLIAPLLASYCLYERDQLRVAIKKICNSFDNTVALLLNKEAALVRSSDVVLPETESLLLLIQKTIIKVNELDKKSALKKFVPLISPLINEMILELMKKGVYKVKNDLLAGEGIYSGVEYIKNTTLQDELSNCIILATMNRFVAGLKTINANLVTLNPENPQIKFNNDDYQLQVSQLLNGLAVCFLSRSFKNLDTLISTLSQLTIITTCIPTIYQKLVFSKVVANTPNWFVRSLLSHRKVNINELSELSNRSCTKLKQLAFMVKISGDIVEAPFAPLKHLFEILAGNYPNLVEELKTIPAERKTKDAILSTFERLHRE